MLQMHELMSKQLHSWKLLLQLKQTYYEVIHYHSVCNNKRLETTQRIINEKLSKKKKKKRYIPTMKYFDTISEKE